MRTTSVPEELKVLVSRGVPEAVIRSACQLASYHGCSPSEYLLRHSIVPVEALYSAIADYCGVRYLPEAGFRPVSINNVPVQLAYGTSGPVLVGVRDSEPLFAIAPPLDNVQGLRDHLSQNPTLAQKVLITTPGAIRHALEILKSPAGELESRYPQLSAKLRLSRDQAITAAAVALGLAIGIFVPAEATVVGVVAATCLNCGAAGIVRMVSAQATYANQLDTSLPDVFRRTPIRWPAYTVLVPLYREAASVPSLVRALSGLDYPSEQLEIKFLVESDDHETAAAFEGNLLPSMEVLVVPDGAPRTKPRALMHGLALARGELVTVYDAEDRPQPDQLKKAAVAFAMEPDTLACLQGRLAIDNSSDGFLSRQFALEYAVLFDQLLPWFSGRNWPFPLGGSSNHFRRSALEAVGGWDPYNVTEDADLGVRLARFGFSSAVLGSSTFEEAPAAWPSWTAQRARWYKGWFQTVAVHLRRPRQIVSEIGWKRLLPLTALVCGSFLMIAVHPLFVMVLMGYAIGIVPLPAAETLVQKLLLAAGGLAFFLGYSGAIWSTWQAAAKRKLKPGLVDFLMLPLYWLCASVAFYRAIWDFLRKPHHWHKTEHGSGRRAR